MDIKELQRLNIQKTNTLRNMKLHLFSRLNNIGVSTMTNARHFRNLTFLVLSLFFAVDVFAQPGSSAPFAKDDGGAYISALQ